MLKKIFVLSVIFLIAFFVFINFNICDIEKKRFTIEGNKNIEFVSIIKNCGATTGYNYRLYMLKKDKDLSFFNQPLIELNEENLQLMWKNNYELIIKTKSREIYNFTNFEYIDNIKYKIILQNN